MTRSSLTLSRASTYPLVSSTEKSIKRNLGASAYFTTRCKGAERTVSLFSNSYTSLVFSP